MITKLSPLLLPALAVLLHLGDVQPILAQVARPKTFIIKAQGLPSGAAQSPIVQTASIEAGSIPPGSAQPAPTLDLYRRLREVGLDSKKVFGIRDGSLDRQDIHITFTDGTIAFTEPIEGKITGAFFTGEGEILVVPPNLAERASLALFTKSAVLEVKFTSAYLRFSDDQVESDLSPNLRPAEETAEFIAKWDPAARNLAAADTLRLLTAFTNKPFIPAGSGKSADRSRNFLHVRLGGTPLGSFEVQLDPNLQEQIYVAQPTYTERGLFYDVWMSFSMRSRRRQAASNSGAAALGPDSSPSGYPLRILKYEIKAEVRPPTDLSVDAMLTLKVMEPNLVTFVFELSRFLKVSAVTLDGKQLQFIQNEAIEGSHLARQGNDLVAVVFPAPPPAGGQLKLRFVYSGAVLSEAGNGLMYVGARGTWYPNLGPAMADFDLQFRHSPDWTLVATGKRVAQQTDGGLETSRWISERPSPLAGFNLGRYQRSAAQTASGGTIVEAYGVGGFEASPSSPPMQPGSISPGASLQTPAVEKADPVATRDSSPVTATTPATQPPGNLQEIARSAVASIDFFASRLGPFPFSTLALTQMPGPSSQGWPGLIFLSSYVFLSPEQRFLLRPAVSDYVEILFSKLMLPHETAHQWWGDAVFWKSYRDQWVMEALANYCGLLKLEKEDSELFRVVMEHYRRVLSEPELPSGKNNAAGAQPAQPLREAGPVTLGLRLRSSKFTDSYEGIVYGRGTWLFHMLRHLLRDPASRAPAGDSEDAVFYGVLRKLLARFDRKELSTSDVQRAFEEALPRTAQYEGKRSLDWFFDGWVNGTALPALQLEKVKFTNHPRGTTVSGIIRQIEAPQDLVTFVPLYAFNDNKPVFLGTVFADGEETSFQFQVLPGTTRVVLDPYHTVLTKP